MDRYLRLALNHNVYQNFAFSCCYCGSLVLKTGIYLTANNNNFMGPLCISWYTRQRKLPLCLFQSSNGKLNVGFLATFVAAYVVNSVWHNNDIWWHKSGPALAQVTACCLTVPSHNLNPNWLVIKGVLGIHLSAISQVFMKKKTCSWN